MSFAIGLDIGGTKIAAAVFNAVGTMLMQNAMPTPKDYHQLLDVCTRLVNELESASGGQASVGVGAPGMIARDEGSIFAPNLPCLAQRPFQTDLQKQLKRAIALANDADCAALAEFKDGAGQGYRSVFGLILGTGVGGGFVFDGKIVEGRHGLTGEIGHLPLPYREMSDGPMELCGCGQKGCIDKSISGPALVRLYKQITSEDRDAASITEAASKGDAKAVAVCDQFLTTIAKAMITLLHSFDPDIIVVSGGLFQFPGLYQEVPKRWQRFALGKNVQTKLAPALHGSMSGLRGAAEIGRQIVVR